MVPYYWNLWCLGIIIKGIWIISLIPSQNMGFLKLKMAKMAQIKKLLFIRMVDNYILNHSYKKHFLILAILAILSLKKPIVLK